MGDFPSDWRWDGDVPLRLAVGGTVDVPVVLRHQGVAVAWNPSAAAWSTLGDGRAPVVVPGAAGEARITEVEASSQMLSLAVGELLWRVGLIRGVDLDDIDRIELVTAMDGDAPAGARAMAWTGDHGAGRSVHVEYVWRPDDHAGRNAPRPGLCDVLGALQRGHGFGGGHPRGA